MTDESSARITQYYASDVWTMPEANSTIFGKDNGTLLFKEWFKRFDGMQYQRDQTHVIEMGDYTAELGRYQFKASNRDGEKRNIEGKYLNLWKKIGDNYDVVADIWNFNHGVEFKAELQFNEIPSVVTALQSHLPINTPIVFDLAAYAALGDATILMLDGAIIAQVYAEDAMIFSNYRSPPVIGGKAIYDHWVQYAKELASFETLQSRSDEIMQVGEHAIQFSSHIAAWQSGEYSSVSTGKHIRIWKRQALGGLRTQIILARVIVKDVYLWGAIQLCIRKKIIPCKPISCRSYRQFWLIF